MILLIFLIIFNSTNPMIYALDNQTYYARILFDQVYLYKTPTNNNDISNIYFELPKTYFVELLSKQGDFYEARYLNLKGYVKKDSVQAVSSTPTKPFLDNISFRVYAELSQHLKDSPTSQSATLITLPNLTKNITYYGQIRGESLIEGRTQIWYYCKFSAEVDYYGYIYSDFCDEISPITLNTETINYITNPSFEIETPNVQTIPVTNNILGIVIAIISIPALIFIFLILKGTSILSKEHSKRKEVIDY